ncbi:MAG: hypothetical protein DHS20C13_15140 [Thermodesulfobacteriota bacterium]|nr:MAG: hypothetical protein DHS20C13_15140 [Thermodesulfobacteriota bacterium]
MRGWRLRAAGVYLIFFLLINTVSFNQAFADEDDFNLFASDQSTESYQVGDTVLNPEPDIIEPRVNLRPAGFKEYMYDTGIWYGVQWGARLYWVRDKTTKIFDTSFSRWWDNVTEKPEWDDGDTFLVNWIAHPFFGMLSYQFYRERGHDRWSSALGSVIQSFLFEYGIEALTVQPSMVDLVVTPGLGVPIGMAMEELSAWLIEQDNSAATVGAYLTNPMRLFVKDRQIGILNPVAGSFEFSGPFTIGATKEKALDLGYPLFLEAPLPLGRVMADLEVVVLDKDFGDQMFFYSIRLDLPSESGFFGLYIDAPYGGVNNVEGARNGYEFSNITIGAKQVVMKSTNFVVSGGLEFAVPTAFTDGQGRLAVVTSYRRDLPTYIYEAFTATPYLAGAFWKGAFSLQANLGTDYIFNAKNFQGDDFEFRINYGAAAGVNVPIKIIAPTIFVEFDGYTLTSDDANRNTDLFLTPGIRFGKRISPGFAVQIPVEGPTSEIAEVDFIFDFQIRF